MKTVCLLATCSVVLLLAGNLQADVPDLKAGVKIESGGTPIDFTTPVATTVDWNNDGAKDLVIGDFYYGNIYLFLNQGTDLNPVFNGSSKIKSGGAAITTSYG